MTRKSGSSRDRRTVSRAIERGIKEALEQSGIAPPEQGELPLVEAEGAIPFYKPKRSWFIACAGVLGSYALDQLHAPATLAAFTALLFLVVAALWPWIIRSRRRNHLFWTAITLYVLMCLAVTKLHPTPEPQMPTAREIALAFTELVHSDMGHITSSKNSPSSRPPISSPIAPKTPLISAPAISVHLDKEAHRVQVDFELENASEVRTTATINTTMQIDNLLSGKGLADRVITFPPHGKFRASVQMYPPEEIWNEVDEGKRKTQVVLTADYKEGKRNTRYTVRGKIDPKEKVFDIIENKWTGRR